MSKRPDDELAKLLAHPDMRVRQAAQFELAGRDAGKAIPAFANVAKSNAEPARSLARHLGPRPDRRRTLARRAGPRPIVPLLDDADAEVRAQAAHVLGDHHVAAVGEKLTALLKDKESRVRYFAAMGICKWRTRPRSSRSAPCSPRTTTRTRSCVMAESWR